MTMETRGNKILKNSGIRDYSQLESHYRLQKLEIQSSLLKPHQAVSDPHRKHILLVPEEANRSIPMIWMLPGFSGSGEKYLGWRKPEESLLEELLKGIGAGAYPRALYVFVDSWTKWGGSQFIDSAGLGLHQSHLMDELFPILKKSFHLDLTRSAVMGASSGGYGALQLSTRFAKMFPFCVAQAPDSAFELNLLPDLLRTLVFVSSSSKLEILKMLNSGTLQKKKDGFVCWNALAMCQAYLRSTSPKDLAFPIDFQTGQLDTQKWKEILKNDPCFFLPKRKDQIQKLKGIYLQVGKQDEHNLLFGVRKLRKILMSSGIKNFKYLEFEGTHRDCARHKDEALRWLGQQFAT